MHHGAHNAILTELLRTLKSATDTRGRGLTLTRLGEEPRNKRTSNFLSPQSKLKSRKSLNALLGAEDGRFSPPVPPCSCQAQGRMLAPW
ncbi:hypothetical protein JZ751_027339 [Albula glossodonta]|uniref:Uncharacterized protein n=1 Tax=Albula glossodonta TaxID=121402 RepID=A0A8T2NK24_9TELE|nr:hypothetical protein JZ751_027339 [Albula glossodonta]